MSNAKWSTTFVLLGGFMLAMNLYETSEKQQINREGIMTSATSIRKTQGTTRRSGSPTYHLEVQFNAQGTGRQTVMVNRVPRELFDSVNSNTRLQIKYLKESPEKILIVGQPTESPELFFGSLGFLGLGLFGTLWSFARK